MTREEAKTEINKAFEPAFANYIITALTEGATPSERKTGKWIWEEHEYYCSECLRHFYGCAADVLSGSWQYCPHCGAKLEESDG